MPFSGPIDGRTYSALYHSIASNQESYSDESVSTWSYSGDTLFFNGSTSLIGLLNPIFRSEPFPVTDILSIKNFPTEKSSFGTAYGMKPINSPYSWNDDSARYSSLLGSPSFLGRVADREADLVEQSVYHGHYTGSVSQLDWPWLHRHGLAIAGWNRHVNAFLPDPDDNYNWLSQSGYSSQGFMTFDKHYTPRASDIELVFDAYELAMLDCSSETPPTRVISSGRGGLNVTYVNIVNNSFKKTNYWHVDISYEFRLWRGDISNNASYFVHILFDCGFRSAYGVEPLNGMLIPSLDTWFLIDHSTVSSDPVSGTMDSWIMNGGFSVGDRFTIPQLNTGFARPLYQASDDSLLDFKRFHTFNGSRTSRSAVYQRAISLQMNNIRPSSFLAASDAMDKGILLVQSNNLQNLQHLKDVLSLVPDLSRISELLAKAFRGDPSVIGDILDFLSSEILKARFQRDPLIKDTKELVSSELVDRLGPLLRTNYRTFYGEFIYEFPQDENFIGPGKLVLVTRSKVRIYFDISTLMAAVLTANSVGLLPNLARLWSLVPFSFVVDWFTNMSKRLHQVDNQLAYLSLGISWCLWSYKLTYYPSDSELAEYNLVNFDPSNQFGYTVYQREFSRWMPKLSESKFDFLRRRNGPDPVTVGALFYQLLS